VTGEEHRARCGLISQDEWSRIKDLPRHVVAVRRAVGNAAKHEGAGSEARAAFDRPSFRPLYQGKYEAKDQPRETAP
jgi:hypothetical protein